MDVVEKNDNYILKVEGIKKYFPGVKALDGVDFKVRKGEVHALIGENGAGKSTLVKILTGVYQFDSGKIILNNKTVNFKTPIDSQKAGITVIHQEAIMFLERTVLENIFMGHHLRKSHFGLLDWKEMKKRTNALLEKLELNIDPNTIVKNLSVAQRHMVEIIKALSFDMHIVIMDEPTSALSLKEVEELYQIIRQLKKEGKAIVFISHKFDEIYEIADYFTVLRDGKYIGEGHVKETKIDDIIKMMVGRSLDQMFPKIEVNQGPVVLEVKNLHKKNMYKDISFPLHKGEILGFFGLVGSGRTEIMHSLFGISQPDNGEIIINGKHIKIMSSEDALKNGIAYVPEDRQQQGVIIKMNIRENITLPIINRFSNWIFPDIQRESMVTDEYGRKLNIISPHWERLVEKLSGGNQQKVVLAKWLATKPEILILDEPTNGIDVATKAAVHKFMSELAKEGFAIILVSSELNEILGMADNVIVMHEGYITARYTREQATSEKIIKAATGSHENVVLTGDIHEKDT